MKFLSSLFLSALVIGSYGTGASSACAVPGENAYRAFQTRTATVAHPSKRTLMQQIRGTWRK